MTKSELVDILATKYTHIAVRDVENAVRQMTDTLATKLVDDERIEIRGFGSFTLRKRAARKGRNPKTGESVMVPRKAMVHFKPGKELRERVNNLA